MSDATWIIILVFGVLAGFTLGWCAAMEYCHRRNQPHKGLITFFAPYRRRKHD